MRIDLDKKPVTMKLSGEARELINLLGRKWGMNATAAVELAVRRIAQYEGIVTIVESGEGGQG